MAQQAIREYDAKSMRANYTHNTYTGYLITHQDEIHAMCAGLDQTKQWVVKPDQLFGKRGKYNLLGIRLSPKEIAAWIEEHMQMKKIIDGNTGVLDTFLIEPFVQHAQERYISIQTDRHHDIVYFSEQGGIDIEENWSSVKEMRVGVLDELTGEDITHMCGTLPDNITLYIQQLYGFFKEYGFTSLEVNPFTLDESGEIVCLDMVAKVDTCEAGKQKNHRSAISRVKPFGSTMHPLEKHIEALDAETGASLKFSTLNPTGSIGLLLGGGGASVVTIDTLANLGLLEQTINYSELSGNPNYRHNKLFVQGLIDLMCENNHKKQRLCLIGGIANFTRIDVLAKAFVSALQERTENIKKHNIHLLVRRGGVYDTLGLKLIADFCKKECIPCSIADGDVYITDAIKRIDMN